MLKKLSWGLAALSAVLLNAGASMAQVFPVDAATTTTITSVKVRARPHARHRRDRAFQRRHPLRLDVHRGGADDFRVQAREVVGAVGG